MLPTLFATQLIGGSKGMPRHLDGHLLVSRSSVQFEAFPQIENLSWSCRQLTSVTHKGKSNETLIRATAKSYLFDLGSPQQPLRW
jgi:flagellar biosynthesis/type III secretory pathway ATPase